MPMGRIKLFKPIPIQDFNAIGTSDLGIALPLAGDMHVHICLPERAGGCQSPVAGRSQTVDHPAVHGHSLSPLPGGESLCRQLTIDLKLERTRGIRLCN